MQTVQSFCRVMGFDVFEDFLEANLFLNGLEATFAQENHGASGHMDGSTM